MEDFWEKGNDDGGANLQLMGGVLQYAASYGYNVLPLSMLQRYVKGINLQSVVQENPALKLSFGLTFALASMARF